LNVSKDSAVEIRNQILNQYYENIYQNYLFGGGIQGYGISYFENQVEKFWKKQQPERVLEIGGGNGEHLRFVRYVPTIKYVSLDLRPMLTTAHVNEISEEFKLKLNFIQGSAESLPFENCSFDRVFTTCLLHHVDDVLAVLLEVRRVTEVGGEIAFLFPTDPGLLNQIVKRLVSFRRIMKLTDVKPQLLYALDHKNHTQGIMELIKLVYQLDDLDFKYRPFPFFRSWNFNLLVVAKIVKR